MAVITAMSSRGQVVLPKKIRESLNLAQGTQFLVFADGESILLKPIKEPKLSDFERILFQVKRWSDDADLLQEDIDEVIRRFREKN